MADGSRVLHYFDCLVVNVYVMSIVIELLGCIFAALKSVRAFKNSCNTHDRQTTTCCLDIVKWLKENGFRLVRSMELEDKDTFTHHL